MPKAQMILPDEVRRAGSVEFTPIPVNRYDRTLDDELAAGTFTRPEVVRMQRDMTILRTFETMLDEVKRHGKFQGLAYTHRGPAHLSIGQEAAAVGQAWTLDVDDHVYGSHRSHGEILAKGLAAIARLDDESLLAIMRGWGDGRTLRVVEEGAIGSVRELATDFLLYGALAEIFGRDAGFNRGLGGSMHAFFPPFGIYPNNAIVGGSGDIAVGAALFKKCRRQPGIVIANIGDASAGCGPVWEGLCFASMDQFRTLWEPEWRGGLPLVVNFMNNFYGMGGQPVGETMGFGVLARLGAGLRPDQLHAERIDGYHPLAVIDAMRRKREVLEAGEGPVLLDTITYRFSGHSPSDAGSYREKAEVEAWREFDPLQRFGDQLVKSDACSATDLESMRAEVEEMVFRAYERARDPERSPRAELKGPDGLLDAITFSNETRPALADDEPVVKMPREENPRVQQLATRSRSGLDDDGKPLPRSRCIGIRDALFEAILDAFHTDPTLIAYGEENRDWGGAFGVYRGLTESLPYHRLFNAPISEGAIAGTAVGYALEGGRALVEIMYCDFLGRAGDELFNQLAKWQAMSGGTLRMPVVVRVSVGAKYGAQHSQDWTSICAHVPGLKVVFPATPYDAKGLLTSALRGTDPVLFFESQRIYDQPELFHDGGVPAESYEIPLGEPDVKREGADLTILTVGATLYRALEAADTLAAEHDLECEVIDVRSLVPLRYEKVIESVKKTRLLLLASDACERGSILHTIASKVSQFAFDELDAPPTVVGSRNWITPADEVEDAFFPQPSDLIDAVHEHLLPLEGYVPRRRAGIAQLMHRSGRGL